MGEYEYVMPYFPGTTCQNSNASQKKGTVEKWIALSLYTKTSFCSFMSTESCTRSELFRTQFFDKEEKDMYETVCTTIMPIGITLVIRLHD